VLHRSLPATVKANDSPRWRHLIAPAVDGWPDLVAQAMGPVLRVGRPSTTFLKVGARSLLPATTVARALGPKAGALFIGIAAHANTHLSRALSSSAGIALAAAGHVGGWPCSRRGSQSITDALAARFESLGGTIEFGSEVRSLVDLPTSDVVLFDTSPRSLLSIAGNRLPSGYARSLRRFRQGAAAFKIDYALDAPVPWINEDSQRAGTVHVGGAWQEVAAAEAEVQAGRVSETPFVLVGQQSIFDSTRAPEGKHTLWAYCHVPNGCTVDMTRRVEAQIERFAPGFKDRVLARAVTAPSQLEAYNPNCVGGDVAGGATDRLQTLFRPRIARDPYRVPGTNLWLCSASTPPGGGVPGLCGMHAARSVLRVVA
jgi:phytoene dehydrogenase-like protein